MISRARFSLLSSVALNAQSAGVPEVVRNYGRLTGSIDLDRAVYFPDEDALRNRGIP